MISQKWLMVTRIVTKKFKIMGKSISILIPAYNAQDSIRRCLNSIKDQTFKDFEIILSNDGSTDGTLDEIQKFISSHPEVDITIITNPNGGVSKARKIALENALGEWITFVDADDTLPPNALSDLFSQTEDNTDLVVGFIVPPVKTIKDMSTPHLWQMAVLSGVIPPSIGGKLYRRSILLPHMLDVPRNITNGEDALMNTAYAFAMTKPPKFIYTTIYNYVRNTISLSHSTKRSLEYEYQYDNFRLKVVPQSLHSKYMFYITKFRINGIWGCSRSDTATIAQKTHPFFKIINDGIKQSGYKLSPFEWIILNIKSPYILRSMGLIRSICISLNYRKSRLFKR